MTTHVTLRAIRRHTLVNALYTARMAYLAAEAGTDQPQRMKEQFRRQADDAKALAELIEEADRIELTD